MKMYELHLKLKFVPKVPIDNNPALVKIMAWRRPSDKPLYKPMTISSLAYISVTQPQWVKAAADFLVVIN